MARLYIPGNHITYLLEANLDEALPDDGEERVAVADRGQEGLRLVELPFWVTK